MMMSHKLKTNFVKMSIFLHDPCRCHSYVQDYITSDEPLIESYYSKETLSYTYILGWVSNQHII
jgi:hypothetical protein